MGTFTDHGRAYAQWRTRQAENLQWRTHTGSPYQHHLDWAKGLEDMNQVRRCQSCAAPLDKGVCAYCGSRHGRPTTA